MNKTSVSLVGRNIDSYDVISERLDHKHADDIDDVRGRRSITARGCCSGDLCNTILPRDYDSLFLSVNKYTST